MSDKPKLGALADSLILVKRVYSCGARRVVAFSMAGLSPEQISERITQAEGALTACEEEERKEGAQ